MNLFQMMNIMGNPQGYIMQQAAEQMMRDNPEALAKAKKEFGGLEHKQFVKKLRKTYKDMGADVDAIAAQCGITL